MDVFHGLIYTYAYRLKNKIDLEDLDQADLDLEQIVA